MDNSSYAQMMLRNDRVIASALEHGLAAFYNGFTKSMHQMSSGVERAVWYSSCFIDEYQDVCDELRLEDGRMRVCILEFFRRADPIADILLGCVKYVFSFYKKSERIIILKGIFDIYSSHYSDDKYNTEDFEINECDDFLEIQTHSSDDRYLLESIARMCDLSLWELIKDPLLNTESILNPAKIVTTNVTRKTVAYTVAKAAAESISLTLAVRKKVHNYVFAATFFVNLYGIEQEAAMAARKLKTLNSDYYQILYNNDLEMFFFLIESYIPPEIYYPSFFPGDTDYAVRFLKEMLK